MAATSNDESKLTFYPAFCFKASPTHFTWVKMAAADVHRLKRRSEFGDQNLFFYLNHPIRFVSLLGLVVARTDVPGRTILTLDDSSGATVDIVVLKAPAAASLADPNPLHNAPETSTEIGHATEHVTATTQSPLNISPLTPGARVQIKGTLSTFRATMQVHLERFVCVRTTTAEMRFLDLRGRFLVQVLSVPWWVGGEEEVRRLCGEADEEGRRTEGEAEGARRRAVRRVEREARAARRIAREWEGEEVLREKEAQACREAGLELMREIRRRKTTTTTATTALAGDSGL